MNYFAAQDAARKRTGRLVILFLLAVVGVVAALYLPLAAIAASAGELPFWNPPLLGGIAVAVLLVVGLGSLFKIAQLGKGGSAVAEMLGGTLVDPATRDPELRRLMNVVAEMAIASGVPVPPVYLIEEDSINAFAAGYTPQSAVIGVTRGCVRQLDRPQLQGVMAHEFSHILNGDMRLNIRLAGVIFGILVIGVLGWGLFRYVGPMLLYSRGGGGNRNNGGAVGLGIIAFGLLLMAVGAIGTMFGRLIQAAVSRQREFLADASAVQFTRNPRGIAGALRKIGGMPASRGWNAHVSEFGHFFFT
ncbi:MAG: M48 family metalloprotease, partial [Planctomycetota bacterium]|nr:M48 family metalloprotease [Planctomycetota bacterium]